MLQLDYVVTRSFPSRILAPIVFTGAAICLVILVILNTALTAYQIVVTPSPDFNQTTSLWYDRFLPAAAKKQGKNCDPVILGTGSIVTTNQSIFLWDVFIVNKADAGRTSFQYTGGGLASCDVMSFVFTGDLEERLGQIQLYAQCSPSDGVSYVLKTSFEISLLAARDIPTILGGATNGSAELGYGGAVCSGLINDAGLDMLSELLAARAANPESQLRRLTASANLLFCPSSNSTGDSCQTERPQYRFAFAGASYSNGTFASAFAGADINGDDSVNEIMTPFLTAPISNLLQVSAACARIDFGQNNTNNLLINPSNAIPSGTILYSFPAGNGVPEFNTSVGFTMTSPATYVLPDDNSTAVLPVPPPGGPSVFEVAFSCRVKKLKPPGEALIAVLVASLSMFMSGWAIFMFIAVMILKSRRQDANLCVGCVDQQTNAAMAQRPAPYTMQSGTSDYSKHAHSPMAMPSPDPLPVPHLANQQFQGKTY